MKQRNSKIKNKESDGMDSYNNHSTAIKLFKPLLPKCTVEP